MASSDGDVGGLVYLSDYPKLPANAPVGHPHLVDLTSLSEEFPQEAMTIPDLVVTILFKYKPAALTAFLDLNRRKVHFLRSGSLDICISRKGKIVKVTWAFR